MTQTLWAVLAASVAVGCEYLFRTIKEPWYYYLWAWIPLQTFIGYCVYRLVTTPGTSLIDAFIVWTFATIGMRVFVSAAILHDTVAPGTWAALALMLIARAVQVTWR